MSEPSYTRRLFAKALRETLRFTQHKLLTGAAVAIAAIIMRVALWHFDRITLTWADVWISLRIIAGSFVIVLLGAFIVNLFRAAPLLDRKRSVDNAALIEKLRLADQNAEVEKQRHAGCDIQGTIKRGYLDLRTFPVSNTTASWVALTHGCSMKFYIEAANYNDCGTWFKPREAELELRIGDACFHGTWERVSPMLAVDDDSLEEKRLADLFDSLGLPLARALQQGVPWLGYIGFTVSDFDRSLVEGETEISATARILITDTLNKVHSIEKSNVKVLIGRLCFIFEIVSQQ